MITNKAKRMQGFRLDRLVEEWNAACPVDTAVEVTLDDGKIMKSRTTTPAWVMGGHSAMVTVDGISGGYMLSRVRKAAR